MQDYLEIIENTLQTGTLEENRTNEYTIADFGYSYKVELGSGYPLLTTKQMDTFRWDSMLHEVEWYLSGTHHIRKLTEESGIWDAWADDEYNLPSAYGRFWRRYPVPEVDAQLRGEEWMDRDSQWTQIEQTTEITFVYTDPLNGDASERALEDVAELEGSVGENARTYVDYPRVEEGSTSTHVTVPVTVSHHDEKVLSSIIEEFREDCRDNVDIHDFDVSSSTLTFDQVQFVVDALNGDNPYRGPESRRLLITAWHPANAQESSLPPCHFTYVLNVQDGELNVHLTQRSADIALGVPFNIASYGLMGQLIAQQTGYRLGEFSHTLVDAHAYCGREERSEWYGENIGELQERVRNANQKADYQDIKSWILENAPEDKGGTNVEEHNYGYDHVPGLLEQLSREPMSRPVLEIADDVTVNNVSYEDFNLKDYNSHEGLRFSVAE